MRYKITAAIALLYFTAVTATDSGGPPGGPPSRPPMPPGPGLPAALTVYNAAGLTITNSPVSYEQPFATGDMPTGYHAVVYSGATPLTTQQDVGSTWMQDSSVKSTQISFVAPPMSGSSSSAYTVRAVAGAPSTAANISTAQATANTNICVKTSDLARADGTAETGTWRLACLNDIIANYSQFDATTGYGSNPTGGWEYVSKGPVKIGIHAWQFAKRESDNAIHKWLRTDLWVDMRGSGTTPCPCSVSFLVSQPNQFGGVAAGTIGGTTESAYNFSATLYNGGNVLRVFGGARDSRTATVANSKFNTTSSVLDLSGTWVANTLGIFPVTFTCATSCPAGLIAGRVYWIQQKYADTIGYVLLYGAQCDVSVCYGGLAPTTTSSNQALKTTGNTLLMNNAGSVTAHYKLCLTSACVATNSDTAITSGAHVEVPRGSNTYISMITASGSGQVFWNAGIRFSSQGSGTITMTPLVFTNPYTGFAGLDKDANRIWISVGGTVTAAPTTLIGHDFSYLTQKTKATPPYITALAGNLLNYASTHTVWDYYPGTYTYAWDMNVTGDGPGDERISYINHTGAYSLFNPADAAAAKNSRVIAAGFSRSQMYNIDERSGQPMVYNNGHTRNGVTYTAMGPVNPNVRTYPYLGGSLMAPYATPYDTDAFYNRYGQRMDASHLPAPMQAPLLKTGDPEWNFMLLNEANAVVAAHLAPYNAVGATTYYRPMGAPGAEQTRGLAWGIRALGQANFFNRSTNPTVQYIRDLMNDQAEWIMAFVNAGDAKVRTLGLLPQDTCASCGNNFQPWQNDFVFSTAGQEMWRGELAIYTTFVNYEAKFVIGRMDVGGSPAGGPGCLWAGAVRAVLPFTNDTPGDFAHLAQTFVALYDHTAAFSLASGYVSDGGFNPANGGPNPWAGCPSSGLISDPGGSGGYQPSGLIAFQAASAGMGAVLGFPRSATMYNAIRNMQYNQHCASCTLPMSFVRYTTGASRPISVPEFAIGPLGTTQ